MTCPTPTLADLGYRLASSDAERREVKASCHDRFARAFAKAGRSDWSTHERRVAENLREQASS